MTKKVKGFSVARAYAFDKDAETQGVWFNFEGGSRLLIARYGNPEQIKLERSLETALAPRLQSKDEDEAQAARIELNRKCFAQTILKGWENILGEDGETELAYSTEVAEDLLQHPEFFSAVLNFANDLSQFRKYREEAAVKN